MQTSDKLPNEGLIEVILREHKRYSCEYCDNPAHFRHTFILPSTRSAPYAADAESFICEEHLDKRNPPDGVYFWNGTFPATPIFESMFLHPVDTPVLGQIRGVSRIEVAARAGQAAALKACAEIASEYSMRSGIGDDGIAAAEAIEAAIRALIV